MERRKFLGSSIAAAVAGLGFPKLHAFQQSTGSSAGASAASSIGSKTREFYVLRRYYLRGGPQQRGTVAFFQNALVPALNRAGVSPVGVFNLTVGMLTPSVYLLLPGTSLEQLTTVEDRLLEDSEYQKLGAEFLGAGNAEPAFDRIDSSLLHAFQGWPKLTVPEAKAAGTPRVFEMRSYEGASESLYRTKVDMFHNGEFEAFRKAGMSFVFGGEVLVGQRLPKLTYMVSFETLEVRDKKWAAFFATDEWKRLSANAKYSVPGLVANNSIEILSPALYSQI